MAVPRASPAAQPNFPYIQEDVEQYTFTFSKKDPRFDPRSGDSVSDNGRFKISYYHGDYGYSLRFFLDKGKGLLPVSTEIHGIVYGKLDVNHFKETVTPTMNLSLSYFLPGDLSEPAKNAIYKNFGHNQALATGLAKSVDNWFQTYIDQVLAYRTEDGPDGGEPTKKPLSKGPYIQLNWPKVAGRDGKKEPRNTGRVRVQTERLQKGNDPLSAVITTSICMDKVSYDGKAAPKLTRATLADKMRDNVFYVVATGYITAFASQGNGKCTYAVMADTIVFRSLTRGKDETAKAKLLEQGAAEVDALFGDEPDSPSVSSVPAAAAYSDDPALNASMDKVKLTADDGFESTQ